MLGVPGGPGPSGGSKLLMDCKGVKLAVGLFGVCCTCGFTIPVRLSRLVEIDPERGFARSRIPKPTADLEGVPKTTSFDCTDGEP